eukprot:434545_1
MTRTIYTSIQPSIIPTTSFQSTEYHSKNNVGSETENIFQNKHLMIVFGISFILFIILFIVICVLCIFMFNMRNTIKTIKSEMVPQDDHDNDLELQTENTNPNTQDKQKLQNDDEKQYVNKNYGPIVNGSDDSEGEELYNY